MKRKILIVDDDPEQIEFASTVLEENGFIPLSAVDGVDGMNKVRDEKPDLVLLDILMPERGGIALYRELKKREETRSIPIIIVTGVARGWKFAEKMMGPGPDIPAPDGYIQKPMNAEAVLGRIRELLS